MIVWFESGMLILGKKIWVFLEKCDLNNTFNAAKLNRFSIRYMDFWLCSRNNDKMVKNIMNIICSNDNICIECKCKSWIFRKYFIFIFSALNILIRFLCVYVDDYDWIVSFAV